MCSKADMKTKKGPVLVFVIYSHTHLDAWVCHESLKHIDAFDRSIPERLCCDPQPVSFFVLEGNMER